MLGYYSVVYVSHKFQTIYSKVFIETFGENSEPEKAISFECLSYTETVSLRSIGCQWAYHEESVSV